MVIEGMQAVTVGLDTLSHSSSVLGTLHHQFSVDWLVFAQEVPNTDILANIQQAWSNFVKTGQIWALLIGLVVGYVFRSMTSF